MTRREQLATVIDVACYTEDRTPSEQRALLDLALQVDMERGAFVTGNGGLAPPTLVSHVEATYEPSTGRRITLTTQQRKQYDALLRRWRICDECGWPHGAHPLDGCPRYVTNEVQAWRDAHDEQVRVTTDLLAGVAGGVAG